MNVYSKLAKNSVVFSIGNFFSKFITLLMLPFYTRVLSQGEFGQADLIITTITLLVPLLTVNIVEAVVRFSLDKKNHTYGQVLTNSMVFIVVGFTILLCFYPVISKIDFINEFIVVFYILFLIQAIRTTIKQFSRSINLTRVYMISDMLYSLVFVLSNVLFLFVFKIGVLGYLISIIIAYAIDLSYLTLKTKAFKYIKLKFLNKKNMKLMFIYCLPLMPNAIMWWVISISDRYLITYYAGLSTAGLYAVANRFPSIITNIYGFFYKAWQVSAIEEYSNSNKDKIYSNVFGIFFFTMTIFASLFITFNKLIISIFVSIDYYEVWQYTPILVMGAVFSSFSGFLGTNYQAAKQTAGVLYSSLAGALVNLTLNIILIPKYGVYGASFATMISFLLMWIIRIIDTKRFVIIYYPKFRMISVLFLLLIQITIDYLNLNIIIYFVLNLVIIVLIILLGVIYLKHPVLIVYNKVKRIIGEKW